MKSKPKQVILAVSIAIVLALFIGISLETFYPSPKYEDFCDERAIALKTDPLIEDRLTQEDCEDKRGKWNPSDGRGYCDYDYYCRKDLEDARKEHGKVVFIISIVLGFIALLIGWLGMKKEAVASGVMGGGALTIIYGIIRYWQYAQDYLRLVILAAILGILIWIGYKKLN